MLASSSVYRNIPYVSISNFSAHTQPDQGNDVAMVTIVLRDVLQKIGKEIVKDGMKYTGYLTMSELYQDVVIYLSKEQCTTKHCEYHYLTRDGKFARWEFLEDVEREFHLNQKHFAPVLISPLTLSDMGILRDEYENYPAPSNQDMICMQSFSANKESEYCECVQMFLSHEKVEEICADQRRD